MSENIITIPDTDTERVAAILRTFCRDHDRVRPEAVTVTALEPPHYRLDVEGATFRATLLGADSVVLVQVDPADTSVDLAPTVTRRLVAPPEPPPVPDPGLFDVNAERRRVLGLLDQLRHLSERIRLATRQVSTSRSDEVARLSSLAPTDAVDSGYRPVDHSITLRQMARTSVETVALLADLRRLLGEAETYHRATSPRLRDALVALATARSGADSLSAVPSLASLGEVTADRFSQHEVNLDDLTDKLDVLARAVEEVSPLVARFEEAVRIHVAAMLETARRAACHTATATLTRLRAQAAALRVETEAEALARDAAERLDVAGSVPRIIWPTPGSLEPPKLG